MFQRQGCVPAVRDSNYLRRKRISVYIWSKWAYDVYRRKELHFSLRNVPWSYNVTTNNVPKGNHFICVATYASEQNRGNLFRWSCWSFTLRHVTPWRSMTIASPDIPLCLTRNRILSRMTGKPTSLLGMQPVCTPLWDASLPAGRQAQSCTVLFWGAPTLNSSGMAGRPHVPNLLYICRYILKFYGKFLHLPNSVLRLKYYENTALYGAGSL
jgi:hypothetical protein